MRAQVQSTQDMLVIFNAIHEKPWKKDLRTQYSISEKSSSEYCQKDRLSILRTCPDIFLGFLANKSDKNGFTTSFPGLLLLRVKVAIYSQFLLLWPDSFGSANSHVFMSLIGIESP